MVQAFLKRINAIAAVTAFALAALVGSQISEFMQQYTQNMAGRLAEAQRAVDGIIHRADSADMPVYEYLDEFTSAKNPVFQQEGVALRATIDRASGLQEAYRAITNAGMLEKPFIFALHVNGSIAGDVFRHFKPAVPVDTASLLYAATTGFFGVVLYELAKLLGLVPVRMVRRLRRSRPKG